MTELKALYEGSYYTFFSNGRFGHDDGVGYVGESPAEEVAKLFEVMKEFYAAQTYQKRDLAKVIDQILPLIPAENTTLIAVLKSAQDSSRCAAPELQYLFWEISHEALVNTISESVKNWPDWFKEVTRIFSGKEK